MMAFSRLFGRLTYAMNMLSGLILIFMMCTTLADIISRAVYKSSNGAIDLTFIGGVELVKYGLLLMILFALPYSVDRSQVIVDLFTENMKPRLKVVLDGIYTLGFMLLGAAMSYRFFHAVQQVQSSGETTQDLLIPLYYIYGLSSFAMAVLAISALLISIRLFFYETGDKVS